MIGSTSYNYDGLGRLQQAQTNDLTAAGTWRLAWTYDRYGNRLTQTLTGGTMSVGQPQLTIDAATNHISGLGYDANGNLIHDGPSNSNTYAFDAENRMVQSVVSSTTTNYSYDGNNLRVLKGSTVYIYSGTKVIAEYASGAAPTSPSKEYVYSGSKLLATLTGSTVSYHHPDHLSNRVETNSSGTVMRTFGQLPFGETWYENTGTDKWKFTSYERDSETGFDYAVNRYYSSGYGRFMTADLLGGHLTNPQSLNRYAYVINDPINLTDPLGLDSGPGQVICTDGLNGCSITISVNRPFLTDSAVGGGKADTPPPLIFEGGGKKGGGGRTIPDIKKSIFDQFKKKLNDCLKSVFGKDSAKVPEQSLNNTPIIDATKTSAQLATKYHLTVPQGQVVGGENDPWLGPHGTIYIDKNSFMTSTNPNFIPGTFVHELGNILDERMNPQGSTGKPYGKTYGDPNPRTNGGDDDTGSALERCVFGTMQAP